MKGFASNICLLLGLLLAGQTTAGAQQQQQKEHVAQTCEDLPPAELKGTTTVLNSILCDPSVLLHVEENALLWSNGVVDTKPIHFAVHEHGSLTVYASAVEIKRTEVRACTRCIV
ncbi:unnamed protein product [Ectocarpus sp. 12 AP-2014]